MNRIAVIENGEFNGNWFNPEASIVHIKENASYNGHNWVSLATGRQFEHEALYYTKNKKFVLNKWSDYQGSDDVYEVIREIDATHWIIKNNFLDLTFLDLLPKKVQELIKDKLADAEI